MGRRTLNRKELRSDFDAAERQKKDDDEADDDEEEADDDDDEDEDAEDEAEGEADDKPAEQEEDEEVAPPKKPKKAPAKPRVAKPRSRAVKSQRLRVVWGVFNNSNQCVATYEYPRRKEAQDHAAKLMTDKKTTHFVQPVKEPIPAEKATKEKETK